MNGRSKSGEAYVQKPKTGPNSPKHMEKRAIRAVRRQRAGPALEILRDLSQRIERRPTEDELVERLLEDPAFSALDDDELRRSARRAFAEGTQLDNLKLKPAREKRRRVRQALALDKDFDHADPEDALANPILLGGPGLPKRRTLKVGGTRIRRDPGKT